MSTVRLYPSPSLLNQYRCSLWCCRWQTLPTQKVRGALVGGKGPLGFWSAKECTRVESRCTLQWVDYEAGEDSDIPTLVSGGLLHPLAGSQ